MSSFFWYQCKKAYPVLPRAGVAAGPDAIRDLFAAARRERSCVKWAADLALERAFHQWAAWRARDIARACGLPNAWRAQAVEIARARFFDPLDIALFHIDDADACDDYVRRFEWTAISKAINPVTWTPDCALKDKLLFAARCVAAGLPHPPLIAWRRHGRAVRVGEAKGDLLAKPIGGYGGKGLKALPGGDLTALPRQSLAQPRLRSHPDLARLSGRTLLTARIVTVLNERGAPETVAAVLRLPARRGALADNGGFVAPVEIASGLAGPARRLWADGAPKDRWRTHPETGARIEGLRLPDWDAAEALARRAHETGFADYALIGWDIGLTDQGPMVIEGNGKPSVTLTQRAVGRGLWTTRYGELVARCAAHPS